jgi:hypothetical protein
MQGRAVVVVLLEAPVEDDDVGPVAVEFVDGQLDVASVGIIVRRVVMGTGGADAADEKLALVDDGALIHEPGPRAVIVEDDGRSDERLQRGEGW